MTSDNNNSSKSCCVVMNDNSMVDNSPLKYQKDEVRPPALLIPFSTSPTDDIGTSLKPIPECASNDSMDVAATRSSFLSSNTANLIYASTLQMSDVSDFRIPLSRTKTPRTPQSLRTHSQSGSFTGLQVLRRETRSPVDEMCLGPLHQSPSQYLMNRYKASTPKSSDFSI